MICRTHIGGGEVGAWCELEGMQMATAFWGACGHCLEQQDAWQGWLCAEWTTGLPLNSQACCRAGHC